MPDYNLYSMKFTTITPLHIGTGRTLLHEYDYAVHDRKTWVINQSALLEAQKDVDDPKVAQRLATIPPAQLLEDADFVEGNRLFRYVLMGQPRSQAEGIEVQEQFKDVFEHPYIPGSSLKGALRTVIGWHAWKELKLEPDASLLKPRREWAGAKFEQTIFGRDPNNDALRALHVSDSDPQDASKLLLINVRIINPGGGDGAPVQMEAVSPDTTFTGTMKFDLALYSDWARKNQLKLGGEKWLMNLAKIANDHAKERIEAELQWFKQVKNAGPVLDLYRQLAKANLPDNQFFLRLGWGTGWDDKTFGSNLQADEDFMEYIIHRYRMTKGQREAGDAFPGSRRGVVQLRKASDGSVQESIMRPLGWLLVEMNPV
jgi:CRISPR-associated protein Csm5